ncbi:MAG TPA: PKD domain-containing protein, partial [Candidatus Thermoplasmatota archaeon]|nr:PKD domain-containing protein [Candidatus Thermoplasmatota archaeon]
MTAAPNTPNTPNPTDGATNVSLMTMLSWVGGNHPVRNETITYNVYFGTNSIPPEVVDNQTETTYNPGSLIFNTTYFWKIIAWNNYNESAEGPLWNFTTLLNNRPEYGSPSPANGSTENPLSFIWSIPINDTEGNLISWTIECSDGDTSSRNNESNGTKTLSFSYLSFDTQYTVWVNATDPFGSGMYTREWYIFQTQPNLPPVFGTPTPSNGSMNNALNLTWCIAINDPDEDYFTWTIECDNGQSNGSEVASDGTKSIHLSGLASTTIYKIWVNASDLHGRDLTTRWYTFQTKTSLPPVFGTPTPSNGSLNNTLDLNWSIPISDPDGDMFSWRIQCCNGQQSNGSGAANGTKSLVLSDLAYSTTYKVWVNATDPSGSDIYRRRWYVFTSLNLSFNSPPLFSSPNPANGSVNIAVGTPSLLIIIQDPEGDPFTWSITTIPSIGNCSGTGATNGTKTCPIKGLTYATHYTWIVSAYDGSTWTNQSYSFTTVSSVPPPPPPSPPPANQPPIADASIGEPYHGNVNATIIFNGSKSHDPDGNITRFFWSFGDHTNGTGMIATHAYRTPGAYNVTLTVEDEDGATDTDTTSCFITQPNRRPMPPTIIGPTNGTQNTTYVFTVVSTDPDHNALRYTFT